MFICYTFVVMEVCMKILKYKKGKKNEYKILTDDGEYILYDDIIIKHELLLKKEINKKEWDSIIKENNLLKAYYDSFKTNQYKVTNSKRVKKSSFSEKIFN